MKGDFSRDTFDRKRHYTQVLMQQGRVQLDADWNEQQEIDRHLLRTFIADLIGPYGTPCAGPGRAGRGFFIEPDGMRILIHHGHYYVDGILCEQDEAAHVDYGSQPDYPAPAPGTGELAAGQDYLVYLDVWDRHITAIEDESIRETALAGADTCTRTKTVWQAKIRLIPRGQRTEYEGLQGGEWKSLMDPFPPKTRGMLKAWAKPRWRDEGEASPAVPAGAGYRGAENRLYRVEIRDGGGNGASTFVWSRCNGSAAFPVLGIDGEVLTLAGAGKDGIAALSAGDWVETGDDKNVLLGVPGPLRKVVGVDLQRMTVRVLGALPSIDFAAHPFLRRWDQKETPELAGDGLWREGCLAVVEGRAIPIEDGIWVRFEEGRDRRYRTGDYWLVPARTATGDIEWPGDAFMPPRGIGHHYAPLAIIRREGDELRRVADLRSPLRLPC